MKFSFIIFFGILVTVYSSVARRSTADTELVEDYSEEAFERMQLLKQAAIEKYGLPHEIDYSFDPEK